MLLDKASFRCSFTAGNYFRAKLRKVSPSPHIPFSDLLEEVLKSINTVTASKETCPKAPSNSPPQSQDTQKLHGEHSFKAAGARHHNQEQTPKAEAALAKGHTAARGPPFPSRPEDAPGVLRSGLFPDLLCSQSCSAKSSKV